VRRFDRDTGRDGEAQKEQWKYSGGLDIYDNPAHRQTDKQDKSALFGVKFIWWFQAQTAGG